MTSSESDALAQPDWFNQDVFFTCVLESISFATPQIEAFTIRAVIESRLDTSNLSRAAEIISFIKDEAKHAKAHVAFNQLLMLKHGALPMGVLVFKRMLNLMNQRFSAAQRVHIVSKMEHWTAIISAWYLNKEKFLQITSSKARKLFAWHANEEVIHGHVVCTHSDKLNPTFKLVNIFSLSFYIVCLITYFALSTLALVYRGNDRNLIRTVLCLFRGLLKIIFCYDTYKIIRDFWLTRNHPH